MRRFLLVTLGFFLCLEGVCQNSVESYLKSQQFQNHQQEAYKIHHDLIKGIISPEIERLIEDSVADKPNTNRLVVDEILNSDEFRFHSARIDTSVNVGVKPSTNTSVRFRDIYYLGNNQFKEFDLSMEHGSKKYFFKNLYCSV